MKKNQIIIDRLYSALYALSITVGIYIAIIELHFFKNFQNFLIFSIFIAFIYLVELITSYIGRNRKIQFNLNIHDNINELAEGFHKLLLPIFLFLSIVGFSYYNLNESLLLIVLLITFTSFFLLILNTKLFLSKKTEEEDKTHYIYDVIKLLIFFLVSNTLVNFYRGSLFNPILISIALSVTSFSIISLMLWRIKQYFKKSAVYSIITSVLLGIIFYGLILNSNFNPLQISGLLILVFYISTAIIHHKLMNTLSRSVVLEYFSVVLMLAVIIYGIA